MFQIQKLPSLYVYIILSSILPSEIHKLISGGMFPVMLSNILFSVHSDAES